MIIVICWMRTLRRRKVKSCAVDHITGQVATQRGSPDHGARACCLSELERETSPVEERAEMERNRFSGQNLSPDSAAPEAVTLAFFGHESQ